MAQWVSIGAWLEHHGLGKHFAALEEAEIDFEVLALLNEDDLKDIGIRKGPRVKIMHYIKEDRERLAVLASPSYSAAMTPPGSPARFVSPPSPPSPTFNLDFNFASSLVVTELRLEPDAASLGCDEEDAGRAPFSPWVESADSESVAGPVASPQPLPQEDDDRATSPTATGAHCGECAGLLVLYHTNNNRLSSSGRPLSAFGKIMVTDVSEMTKNRQDPEEPTCGEEWLCACCGALNPVDGPDVCACGDVTGKTKGVVLYAGELQKAADRDTSGSIFQKILTHGLSASSKPVAIRFDAEPIKLKQKLKQQGKSAQVKAVNISLAEAPRAKLARHKSTHQAAVHISRVIPIRSKPVVSLSTVIAAEELLKEDQTKEDALNQIDASLPAASHQPQVEGLPALSQLELLYNLQVQQKLQIGADSEGTDKKSGPAAIPKPTAAASEKVMEIRPSSDALDAETVRIRQLQKQRALKAADIGAVTPRDELAEQNLAKSKDDADMMKIKKKVLSLARKKSLRIAISFAQSKNCPDTPNPKDLPSCQRYMLGIEHELGKKFSTTRGLRQKGI